MSEPKVYNFMGRRHLAAAFSITLLVIAVIALAVRGLNYGLDFTGGAQIEVGYEQPADVNQVRTVLTEAGYRDVVVQYFGNNTDVLIRMQEDNNPDLGNEVLSLLSQERDDVELRRNEYVGPQVGEELREKGGIGMIVALGLVMVYIALRFQFKFAVGAVAALIHDVVIVLGFFAVTQFPFDLTVLAAILAVIGYSLNDTIVVADRIRESFRTIRRDDPVYLINISLTQTLSRTVITSLTTLLVLIALGIFGGEMIRAFAEEDLMPPEKEKPDEEEVPSWLKDPDEEKS